MKNTMSITSKRASLREGANGGRERVEDQEEARLGELRMVVLHLYLEVELSRGGDLICELVAYSWNCPLNFVHKVSLKETRQYKVKYIYKVLDFLLNHKSNNNKKILYGHFLPTFSTAFLYNYLTQIFLITTNIYSYSIT